MSILAKIAFVLGVVLAAAVILTGIAILDAWAEFKLRPKKPMFWCHKHGHFPADKCLDLGLESAEASRICPLCYHEAITVKQA